MLLTVGSIAGYSLSPVLIGFAAQELQQPGGGRLLWYALATLAVLMGDGMPRLGIQRYQRLYRLLRKDLFGFQD